MYFDYIVSIYMLSSDMWLIVYIVYSVHNYDLLAANESGTCKLMNEKTTKMQESEYKSSLHYLALQPSHSGLSFEEFLLYFTNKDIGRLDLAISETILRDAFHQRLGYYYNRYIISCFDELKMIVNRAVCVEKCESPNVLIGNVSHLILSVAKPYRLLLPCYRWRRGSAVANSVAPHQSSVIFDPF